MNRVLRRVLKGQPRLWAFVTGILRLWKIRWFLKDIYHDLCVTRREASVLRNVHVEPNGRRVLVLAIDDSSIYSLKLFALVASSLRLRGWQPLVLLRDRSCWLGHLYFGAYGIEDFIYLDDQRLATEDRKRCRSDAEAYLGGDLDLQKIKAWRYGEAWLGPHMIATLSRVRFEGMPDFSDPSLKSMLASVLPESLGHVMRARILLEQHMFDLALGIEVNYSMFGPIVDACVARGINVVQLIQPWKDDALIFKRLTSNTRRDHPASVDRSTLELFASEDWTAKHDEELDRVFADRYSGKWFLQSRNQRNTREVGRAELLRTLELDPRKPIATVFSHVLWDANLFYGEDLFKDYGDWFVQTVRAAVDNDRVNWLIKIHPANVWKRAYENVSHEYAEVDLIRRHIGSLPAHVRLLPADTHISTMSLFRATDFGVTVRGTSGIELPCFGKPCLTAGTGRYSGLGFTIDVQSAEEYLDRLATLHLVAPLGPDEVKRARWHAYIAFALRPWTMKSARSRFRYLSKGRHPLDHNLTLTVGSIGELERNGDLTRCGMWLEGVSVDYIESDDLPQGFERSQAPHFDGADKLKQHASVEPEA